MLKHLIAGVASAAMMAAGTTAQAVEYTTAHPLASVVTTPVKPCGHFPQLPVPVIAWGADIATLQANGGADTTQQGSAFAKEGLNVKLYRQDRLVEQVKDFLACRTPFLRVTAGMLAQAGDAIAAAKPIALYQLSWSEGGDVLVARDSIKSPADLLGKKIALQAYGPHVDFLATVLRSAGLKPTDVQIAWVADITEGNASSQYPAKALREDGSVDAAFVISPDAAALTSGKGENAVSGAHALFSTKTASRIIADLYVVRSDWLAQNQRQAEGFVHALLIAQEATQKLFAEKTSQKKALDNLLGAAAKLLLDDASLTAEVEGMWGDLTMAGYRGNVDFFTNDANPRSFTRIITEAGEAMTALRLVSKPASIAIAPLNYAALAAGLTDTSGVDVSRFNKAAVDRIVRERQQKDASSEGQLFSFEIRFQPNQQTFSADLYGAEFDRVIELVSTYGGALLTIEGHADTLAYLKRKQNASATTEELSRMRQSAKNLTLQRSIAVRESILAYAKGKGIALDANQFSTIGYGFAKPNVRGCAFDRDGDVTASCAPQTKEDWDAMRRVVFRVVSVEAESDAFSALK